MKKGDIVYAIVSVWYGYSVEKVKLLEDFSLTSEKYYVKVKHLDSVGSSGVPVRFIFINKHDAETELNKIRAKEKEHFKDEINTKEKLVDFLYSCIELNENREIVKESIKELLGVEVS